MSETKSNPKVITKDGEAVEVRCEHCHKPHDHAHSGYVSELCRECCIKTGFHD